ncbi:MAG: hypothetical protein H7282_13190 [Cytophagaceae bacterium]|nr:hypothetical protein [Cytophagaceae bacterium]
MNLFKTLLIWTYFIFLSNNVLVCQAQDFVIKSSCADHKKGSPNREAAYSYFDTTSQKLYLTFMDKYQLYLKTYSDLKEVDSCRFERTEDAGLFNQVSEAAVKDDLFYLLFSNPTCAYFSIETINLRDKTIQRYPEVFKISEDELYLYSFSDQGTFYILASVIRTNIIRLYKYDFKTNSFKVNQIALDAIKTNEGKVKANFWKVVSSENRISFANPDIIKYSKSANPASNIDPYVASKYLKFYPDRGHLVLTIDNYFNATLLIDVNLSDFNYSIADFYYREFPDPEKYFVKANSFLFNQRLIQVIATSEKMDVYFIDAKNKQLIETFSCLATDVTVPFANGPIKEKSKDNWGAQSEHEIGKVKKMLSLFSKNNVFITALIINKGDIELTIGSHYFISGINGGSATNTCFTSSLLDSNYSPYIGLKRYSLFNRVIDRRIQVECSPKAKTVFTLANNYYMGYFKKDDHNENSTNYVVEQF